MKPGESSQLKSDHFESNSKKEDQFFSLFERYQDPIFRFLYFRSGNRAVALDITQDTFTKTWMYLASGKTITHEEGFLYRTARNALIDYYKRSKSASLDALMESGFDPEDDLSNEKIFKGDDMATVRSLVEGLDEESKQIVFLRFSEERPIEEIAILFGKTTNAMTVQIHRIMKKLRGRFTNSK
ncbi:MAG TPA: sigma-70 family RNA polymerase sigma factor [Candidatus Paceibacterota bacterium]|jgi:RNA polymerase sigma-70 factor (ECF subfamily)|nr:sigma-70 family RNA polymerase sigma factor [Candidatus Paceibacterota bacterium]